MRKQLLRLVRQSPAMMVAMIALFVALSGTAVATTSALITGNQIKNSSITGADVKNKSLTPRDFRGSVRGPRGLRGLTGAAGAPGAAGAAGAAGAKGDKGDKGDPAAIAYGNIAANGSVSSATSNVSSTWNAALSRYEITIAGESYFFSSYATTITPVDQSPGLIPGTSSVSGKLLVVFRNAGGTAVQTPFGFGFVVYKP